MKAEQYKHQQIESEGTAHPPANTRQTRVIYVKDARQRPRGRGWGFGAFVIVLLLVIGAVWMMDVSGTMDAIKDTTTQNSQKLDNQSTQLTTFNEKLNNIEHGITEMGKDIKHFFSQLIDKLNLG